MVRIRPTIAFFYSLTIFAYHPDQMMNGYAGWPLHWQSWCISYRPKNVVPIWFAKDVISSRDCAPRLQPSNQLEGCHTQPQSSKAVYGAPTSPCEMPGSFWWIADPPLLFTEEKSLVDTFPQLCHDFNCRKTVVESSAPSCPFLAGFPWRRHHLLLTLAQCL